MTSRIVSFTLIAYFSTIKFSKSYIATHLTKVSFSVFSEIYYFIACLLSSSSKFGKSKSIVMNGVVLKNLGMY